MVGEDVLRAVDRREGWAGAVTVAGGARGEAVELDSGEEIREEVGAVRRGVEAGKDLRRRAVGGGVDEVGSPGRESARQGRGSKVGRDRAVKSGRSGDFWGRAGNGGGGCNLRRRVLAEALRGRLSGSGGRIRVKTMFAKRGQFIKWECVDWGASTGVLKVERFRGQVHEA